MAGAGMCDKIKAFSLPGLTLVSPEQLKGILSVEEEDGELLGEGVAGPTLLPWALQKKSHPPCSRRLSSCPDRCWKPQGPPLLGISRLGGGCALSTIPTPTALSPLEFLARTQGALSVTS